MNQYFFSISIQLFLWALINNWFAKFLIRLFSFLLWFDIKSKGVFIVVVVDGRLVEMGILDFFVEVISDFLVAGVVSLLEVESSVEAILYT